MLIRNNIPITFTSEEELKCELYNIPWIGKGTIKYSIYNESTDSFKLETVDPRLSNNLPSSMDLPDETMSIKEAINKGYVPYGTDYHQTNLTAWKYVMKILGFKIKEE